MLKKVFKKWLECDFCTLEESCKPKCNEKCIKKSCRGFEEVEQECKECLKNQAFEILRTSMVDRPAIVFTRHYKRSKRRTKAHNYCRKSIKSKTILGYDVSSLYLYCSGLVIPWKEEKQVKVKTPISASNIIRFSQDDIEVPEEFYEKLSEMALLFFLTVILISFI